MAEKMDRATLQFWIQLAAASALFFGAFVMAFLLPLWMAIIGFVVSLIWLGWLLVRYRRTRHQQASPKTATFSKSKIGELSASVDSTADELASETEVRKWTGWIRHRPRRKDGLR